VRILYHHRTRSRDGQRVHIDGLVGAFRRAGHEIEIVAPTLRVESPRPGAQRHGSVEPRDESGPPRASALREAAELAYNLVESARLRAAARRFQPDALYSRHALFTTSPGSAAAALALPLVIEVNAPLALERARHGGLSFEALARRLETRALNRADRVVAVTKALADRLAEQGVAREKLEVHWNGLEPEALARRPDGAAVRRRLGVDQNLVLGFVGFVRDWNRLERAFPFLAKEPRAVLLLVGEGPDRPRLEREASRAGVADRVRFLGTVARSEVIDHVAAFDVALLPETPEYASPLKLLDYLAAGRALLAPDRRNLREVISDGENGLLFDPERPSAFDEKLAALAASSERRERLGAAARATIDRLGLTWDRNAARVVALFAAEIERRRAAGGVR